MTRAVQPSKAGTVPWPQEVAARYTAAGYWQGRALGEYLIDVADATPDAVAVTDGDVRLSYAELLARADGAALRLRDLGLAADDRIIVQLHNGWEFVVLITACFRLGVIPVTALTAYRKHELSYLTELAEARAIAVADMIKDFDHQALAHTIAAEAETIEHVLVAGASIAPGSLDLRALCEPAEDPGAARAELDQLTPDPGSAALMLLSGGTTGMPKLIARTHDDYHCYVAESAAAFGFSADSVYLGVLPFGHNFPLSGILGVLWAGGRLVVAPSPAPEGAFAAIERERVTATAVVPAILTRWLEYRAANPGHDLSSWQVVTIGAARMQDHLLRKIRPLLGCTLQQGYGMAEGQTNLTRLDDPDDVIRATQGRPICAGDEVLVVDEHGDQVAPGELGELLARGPYTIRGYYRAPEQNAAAFTADGWYRSGDLVRRRPDGYLVVEGRKKDVIKRGGENVPAEEVEHFAYQLAGVQVAAAVAMPDPVLGERVCLYIVPDPGAQVRLPDIIEIMQRAGVARFKQPERLITVDTLPLTPIGKVDKKALRADIAERSADQRSAA